MASRATASAGPKVTRYWANRARPPGARAAKTSWPSGSSETASMVNGYQSDQVRPLWPVRTAICTDSGEPPRMIQCRPRCVAAKGSAISPETNSPPCPCKRACSPSPATAIPRPWPRAKSAAVDSVRSSTRTFTGSGPLPWAIASSRNGMVAAIMATRSVITTRRATMWRAPRAVLLPRNLRIKRKCAIFNLL